MSSVSTVFDFAAELLAVATAALATTPAGAPEVRFVSFAIPALDCPEQLTVDVRYMGNDTNLPSNPPQARGHLTQYGHLTNIATFVVTMTRCVPTVDGDTGFLPEPAATTAATKTILEDGWAFWNYVSAKIRAGELFGGRCITIYRDPGIPVQSQGGSAGWSFAIRPIIDGYDPTA